MNRWPERRSSWIFVLPPVILLVFLISAAPASAHTSLVNTTPADGKQLTSSPGGVSLTFSGEVLKLGATVKVTGPDGTVKVGAVKLKSRTVSWPIGADLVNGEYAVSWRVTSGDGHPIDGKFDFVLAAPVQTTGPTTGPATTAPAVTVPTATPHTAEPGMTGPMEGMEGMPGMDSRAATPAAGSTATTGLAIAGLVLLAAVVAGAIVIERRRRPAQEADPSARSNG